MRVLVVEDDLLVAGSLCALVQEAGNEVVGLASESESAVALLETVKIDLALLDLRLSNGLTGGSVAQAAVKAGVPFVYVTANLRLLFGQLDGAFGVIAKPYDDETIVEVLAYIACVNGGRSPGPLPFGLILSLEMIERLGLDIEGPAITDGAAA